MIKIVILGELCDLNEYIRSMNSSRWSGADIKRIETNRIAKEIKTQRIPAVESYPVICRFNWFIKDRRKDIDNIAFAKKFLLDGMVIAGVLKNDSQKFVKGFRDYFHIDKENPRVEIIIVS